MSLRQPDRRCHPWNGGNFSYDYDDGNRLTRQYTADDVTTFWYNGLDQLIQQETRQGINPNAPLLAGFYNLTYDAAGNLTSLNDWYAPLIGGYNGTRTFAYDAQDRLIEEKCQRPIVATPGNGQTAGYDNLFAYDAADNFTVLRNKAVTQNADMLTGDGNGYSYLYDIFGNTTQVTNPQVWQQPLTLTYDMRNCMNGSRLDGLMVGEGEAANGTNYGQIYRIYDGERLLFDFSGCPTARK